MKIKIKDLEPNPYRDLNNYPMDLEKIESLKASIIQTGFWDNILARKQDGKYQIAYGHHRLAVLRAIFNPDDEIDIPVKDLDNATMIQIMANENMEQWQSSPAVVLETVKAIRDFLNSELAKCETWEEATSNKSIRGLFETQRSFETTKGSGVGQTTILKFLGTGWKQWMIQDSLKALEQISSGELDEEAAKTLPSVRHLKEFSKELSKANEKISKEKQRKIVKQIKKDETPSRGIGAKFLEEKWKPIGKDKKEDVKKKEKMLEFDTFLSDTHKLSNDLANRIKLIDSFKEELGSDIVVDKLNSAMLTVSFKRLLLLLTNIIK